MTAKKLIEKDEHWLCPKCDQRQSPTGF